MPLVKATIKASIKSAFIQVMEQQKNREEALDEVTDRIANTLVEAVKGMQITYTSGLVAPPMGGLVTGIFQCVISW